MDRRRSTRRKRRIPCEFQHRGHRYRGIAVNISPSGLFIQTNATLDSGVDLEVVFLGDRLPGLSVRGTVVRRRAPPAALASVIRAGLGLRIAEAPDAYFEFLGEESPETEQRREDPAEATTTPLPEAEAPAVETSQGAERGDRKPAAPRSNRSTAVKPASERAEPIGGGETLAPETLGRHGALLIDDGELDDVYAMLEALGADPVRYQPDADEDFGDWENPPRAVVVSASAAPSRACRSAAM